MGAVPAGAGSLVGQHLGKYQMLALLALGGTAEIYLARIEGTSGFEKYVVVKCLHDHLADDQEFVKMFLDEARLGATLDHSNIVQTLELGEQDGRYYMAMEFLAGMSLAMIARKAVDRVSGGRIPVQLVLGMAAQACAGLHYAHERTRSGQPMNIVHRDISPQNLVLTFEGVVKIVDFGIAKAELRETHTKSGTIKGKFAYMSPEQCLAKDVDRRTDVFALGVILHELVTGRRLFKRSSTYDTYQAILDCKVPVPSSVNHELDPGLDSVIMRALAKDREQRYPTAEAFGEALIGYLHHRGKHAGPGDISRFFDQYYQEELDEHATRMRELIEGREQAEALLTWDGDADSGVATKMPDDEAVGLDTSDVELLSAVSAISELGELGDTGDSGVEAATDPQRHRESVDEPDDDAPVEATRIEANPLAAVLELEREREGRLAAAPRLFGGEAKAKPAIAAPTPAASPRAGASSRGLALPSLGRPPASATPASATPAKAATPTPAASPVKTPLPTRPALGASPVPARVPALTPVPARASSAAEERASAQRAATAPERPRANPSRPPRPPVAPAESVDVPGEFNPDPITAPTAPVTAGPGDATGPVVAPPRARIGAPPAGKRRTSPPPHLPAPPHPPTPTAPPTTPRSRASTQPMPTPEAAAIAGGFKPEVATVLAPAAPRVARGFASAPEAKTMFDAPAPAGKPGFGVSPELVSTTLHDPRLLEASADDSGVRLPSEHSLVPPPSANPAGAMANVELPLPAHLIGLPPIEQVFTTSELSAIEDYRTRKLPPWALVLLFVVALGLALGLTIALARALR